jgi:signal transduction histidine kinase
MNMETGNNLFKKTSYWGVNGREADTTQKNIILSNRISLAAILVAFIFLMIDIVRINHQVRILIFSTIILIFTLPLWLNRFGYTRISRAMIALAYPLLGMANFILFKLYGDGTEHVIYYFTPRFFMFNFIVIAFLVLDSQADKWLYRSSIFLNAFLIIFFDAIHNLFGVGIDRLGFEIDYYYLSTVNSVIVATAIILSFAMLQSINRSYESKILSMNNELADKNEEIIRQNEALHLQQAHNRTINNHLEEVVNRRTAELKARNNQLSKYAFFNAHVLRAPVATILGLHEIYALARDEEERKYIQLKLQETCKKLDDVVRNMQETLNEDYPEEEQQQLGHKPSKAPVEPLSEI